MNKKGDIYLPFVILFIVILSFILFAFTLMFDMNLEPKNCKIQSDKLVAVNGDYDYNSGLFSGGSKQSTTMLFESGLVIQEPYLIKKLQIGGSYIIKECESRIYKHIVYDVELQ